MNMEQLQKENDELKEKLEAKHLDAQAWANASMWKDVEINGLRAHVERLREAYGILLNWEEYHEEELTAAQAVIDETPAQSILHIESRVEEETIERILGIIEFESENADSEVDHRDWRPPAKEAVDLMYRYARSGIKTMPRKYKEKSDD